MTAVPPSVPKDRARGNPYADYGIVTALRDELDALRSVLSHVEEVQLGTQDIRHYYRGRLSCRDDTEVTVVCVRSSEMGQLSALSATHNLITAWKPRHVLLVGIAGGFPGRGGSHGDVVIPLQVHYYEPGKQVPAGPGPDGAERYRIRRWQTYATSPKLGSTAEALAGEKDGWMRRVTVPRPDGENKAPKVLRDELASGEEVWASLESSVVKEVLAGSDKILAVENEAAGFLKAVFESNFPPDALVIKALSDLIAGKDDRWRLFAAQASAAFAVALIEKLGSRWLSRPGEEPAPEPPHPFSPVSPEEVRAFTERFRSSYQPYPTEDGKLSDPAQIYVQLKCRPTGAGGDPPADALAWLRDAGGKPKLLLSQYGFGKSFAALELQRHLVEDFARDPDRGLIPVVFPLKLRSSKTVLEDLYDFLRELQFPVASRADLESLLRTGRMFVIFDAIDEIPLVTVNSRQREPGQTSNNLPNSGNPHNLLEVLERLDLRPLGPSPWVATSRTELFAAVLPELEKSVRYGLAYLLDWDLAQWRTYVDLCVSRLGLLERGKARNSFLQAVEGSPRLRELTNTPLLARMLVSSWPNIQHNARDFNRIRLYQSYTDYILKAREDASTLPDLDSRRRCLESAAVHFFKGRVPSCSPEELIAIADAYVHDVAREDLAAFVRSELQTYSLLVYDSVSNSLGFSHRSFHEYFLARAVLRELRAHGFNPAGLLQLGLEPGEAAFLGALLAEEEHGALGYTLAHLLRQDGRLSPPLFRRNLVLLGLGLANALNHGASPGEPAYAPFVGAHLQDLPLTGLDLSGCDFHGADLRSVHAVGTSFAGADLRGCNLTSARLTECDVQGADLRDARLDYCVFTRLRGFGRPPRLARASLRGIVVSREDAAYLSYAVEYEEEADEAWRIRALRAIEKGTIDGETASPVSH